MFLSSLLSSCSPPVLAYLKLIPQGMSLKWRVNTEKHANVAYHSTLKAWHPHAHPWQDLQSFSNVKQALGHGGHLDFPKVSSTVPTVPLLSLLPSLIKKDQKDSAYRHIFLPIILVLEIISAALR